MDKEKKKTISEWEQTDTRGAAADDTTSEATEVAEGDTNTSAKDIKDITALVKEMNEENDAKWAAKWAAWA